MPLSHFVADFDGQQIVHHFKQINHHSLKIVHHSQQQIGHHFDQIAHHSPKNLHCPLIQYFLKNLYSTEDHNYIIKHYRVNYNFPTVVIIHNTLVYSKCFDLFIAHFIVNMHFHLHWQSKLAPDLMIAQLLDQFF